MMNFLYFAGGLGFFLFGMSVMESGLKSLGKGKVIPRKAYSGTLRGILFGCILTAITQSSSSVTVTLISLVETGAVRLSDTIGIIIGANIGTSSTAWIISLCGGNLSIAVLYPAFILAGSLIIVLFKKDKLGYILSGFALILAGMEDMSAAVTPLFSQNGFENFTSPISAFLGGLLITAVIQSSSASVGILQALSVSGGITLGLAAPIIIGQNIGTCVTALLACLTKSRRARGVFLLHLLFNIWGAVICGGLLFLFRNIVPLDKPASPIDIALFHTAFNTISFLTAVIPISLCKSHKVSAQKLGY